MLFALRVNVANIKASNKTIFFMTVVYLRVFAI